MWLFVFTIAAAALVVILTRGSFARLARVRVMAPWMLLVGFGIQIALEYVDIPKDQIETIGFAALMASYALILAFCLANVFARGFGIIAIGIAMNALVIGLNQGMPTKPIGNDAQGNRIRKPVEQTVKHRQASEEDLLGILGDKILLPEPFDMLISFGDLVLGVGVCELAYFQSRRTKSRRAVSQ